MAHSVLNRPKLDLAVPRVPDNPHKSRRFGSVVGCPRRVERGVCSVAVAAYLIDQALSVPPVQMSKS